MRLPQKGSSVLNLLGYGRYVSRRLRRAKLSAEEAEVDTLGAAIQAADQAETALEQELFSRYADRDGLDDELDDVSKRHRQAIEGRATNANRERPYTDIYPDGIAWYTASPLAEQVSRYELLVRRYDSFLPEGDPVRAEGPNLLSLLSAWKEAKAQLDQLELDVAMARAKTAAAVNAWEEGLRRLYFRLAERFGKTQAERFFPKPGRGGRAVSEPEGPDTPTA